MPTSAMQTNTSLSMPSSQAVLRTSPGPRRRGRDKRRKERKRSLSDRSAPLPGHHFTAMGPKMQPEGEEARQLREDKSGRCERPYPICPARRGVPPQLTRFHATSMQPAGSEDTSMRTARKGDGKKRSGADGRNGIERAASTENVTPGYALLGKSP